MSDDLDTELDEFEDNEDEEENEGGFQPERAKALIKKLRRQLDRQKKGLDGSLQKAREEAVEEFKASQTKVAQAKEVFSGLGYEGFAGDFLALHPDTAEVAPDAAKEWLTARGLEVKTGDSETPTQEAPAPPPAAKFHQAGSSGAPSTSRYSPEEFRALILKNPDEAKRVVREGLVDYEAKPAQSPS